MHCYPARLERHFDMDQRGRDLHGKQWEYSSFSIRSPGLKAAAGRAGQQERPFSSHTAFQNQVPFSPLLHSQLLTARQLVESPAALKKILRSPPSQNYQIYISGEIRGQEFNSKSFPGDSDIKSEISVPGSFICPNRPGDGIALETVYLGVRGWGELGDSVSWGE